VLPGRVSCAKIRKKVHNHVVNWSVHDALIGLSVGCWVSGVGCQVSSSSSISRFEDEDEDEDERLALPIASRPHQSPSV
jgi:hypothetical protein